MGEAFDRTTRAIEVDRSGRSVLALAIGAALLIVWVGWMTLARVPVRAVSEQARIEAALAPREVQAAVTGAIVGIEVRLGDPVRQGDPLVRLDDAAARAAVADAEAVRDGLDAQTERLTSTRGALAGVAQLDAAARSSAAAAARADADQGRIAAQQAVAEAATAEALAGSGAIGAQELDRARSDARRLELDAAAREQVWRQLSSERAGGERGGDVDLGRLDQELADLASQRARAEVAASAARAELARHTLTAPVDGRVGALAVREVGGVVRVGDAVATIVPDGALRVVAWFAPATALGRVAPGQAARMRLDGFPWTTYGAVPARVDRIGEEPDERGRVRVELAVLPEEDAAVPLRHGLPGQVEVEVERVAPATLILRAAGRRSP